VIAALRQVGAKKIVVATPYLDEINEKEAVYLENAGFEVLSISGLNLEKDSDMVRVTPDFIARFASSIDRPDADAVFISCGAIRSLDVVDQIEQNLGKPVICSNQAMIWECLRLAGIDDRISGYGSLLSRH
jgi:maleate isomerase